jgi:hypothetical protein
MQMLKKLPHYPRSMKDHYQNNYKILALNKNMFLKSEMDYYSKINFNMCNFRIDSMKIGVKLSLF